MPSPKACAWALLLTTAACGGLDASQPRTVDVGARPAPPPHVRPPAPASASLALPALPPFTALERQTMGALVERQRIAPSGERDTLLDELAERFGGRGLAQALFEGVPSSPPEARWLAFDAILSRLEQLADPSAADELARFVAQTDDVHVRGRAAVALAQLGDLRAAGALAARLRVAPEDVYDVARPWETGRAGHLARTDRSRIDAARALDDLAALHPAARADLARTAEDAVLAWAEAAPAPHVHALRFLGRVRSSRAQPALRRWAMPDDRLPEPGASPPFPIAFEIAQSSLRALGASHAPEALADLELQLARKEPTFDNRMEALASQGHAMRGMALRALGYGAAQGIAELGPDVRAEAMLERALRDPLQNEEVRDEACAALVHVVSEVRWSEIVAELPAGVTSPEVNVESRAACILAVAARRPPTALTAAWLPLLRGGARPYAVAPAAGLFALVGADGVETTLRGWLGDDVTRPIVVAVLALGASGAEDAVRAAASRDARVSSTLDDVLRATAGATEAQVEVGVYLRWGRRFRALGEPTWLREPLERHFETVAYDWGPHTVTRVVLRRRLVERAAFGDAKARADVATVLALMKERGALAYVQRLR